MAILPIHLNPKNLKPKTMQNISQWGIANTHLTTAQLQTVGSGSACIVDDAFCIALATEMIALADEIN